MSNTEEKIKSAAKKLFFEDGHLHATTQEIADAAGVNRSLLNYYFRSRDALFDQVFQEARLDIHNTINELLKADLPFKEKVSNFVRGFSESILKAPYSEAFLVSEINDCKKASPTFKRVENSLLPDFLKEVEMEMEKGTIRQMHPLNFLMNIFAMISHPIIMKPLYKEILGLKNQDIDSITKDRTEIIIDMIFSKD